MDQLIEEKRRERECGGHMAGKVTLSDCTPTVCSPLRRKRAQNGESGLIATNGDY